jgi:putative DNA primase/helicase
LAFGGVRAIYDRYGGIFGQTELESQFNGWASGKLFMIGNEVVSRVEKYHLQGRLKNMVTESEWQINEKNLPARLEANHCNFVFFSNRIDIAQLDPDDRRYCVIWTPPALSEKFYADVAAELRNGGVAALHHHLLGLDLGDFGPHIKPPLTRGKRELIALSLDSTERFFGLWRAGHLAIPYSPCLSMDLYAAYRHWAQLEGVPKPAPNYVLLGAIGKKPGITKGRQYHHKPGTTTRTRSMCVIPPGHAPAEGVSEVAWLTEKIAEFAEALSAMKEQK